MRLIDADSLKKDIVAYKTMPEIRKAICDVIDNAPTVEEKSYAMGFQDGLEDGLQDMRPQGEWEYVQYDSNPNIGNWHCSECRHIPLVFGGYSQKPYYNFCPNCGADMRGKEE